MEKKGTKIAYFVACAVFVVLLVVLGISFKGAPLPEFVIDGETVQAETPFAGTFWSLLPPIVAIALALISKEVYSSLFLGCLVGALLYTQFNPWNTIVELVGANYGIISVLADAQEETGAIMQTGAAVASIMYASLARLILWPSVTGRITAPTVRQLK